MNGTAFAVLVQVMADETAKNRAEGPAKSNALVVPGQFYRCYRIQCETVDSKSEIMKYGIHAMPF